MGGYFSGDPQDDFHGPDGSLPPDTETLHSAGRTWSPQVSRSITGPIPLYPHNRVSWCQSLAFCGLTAHSWPFQACEDPAEAQIYCVHNLCVPGGSREILCAGLGSYAQRWQLHGLPLQL